MTPNDARDIARSDRVTLTRQHELALPNICRVDLDGDPVGLVIESDTGWLAARPGWRDDRERPKRAAAVRRLLVSLPDAKLETATR